jgi:hypothetical protein
MRLQYQQMENLPYAFHSPTHNTANLGMQPYQQQIPPHGPFTHPGYQYAQNYYPHHNFQNDYHQHHLENVQGPLQEGGPAQP